MKSTADPKTIAYKALTLVADKSASARRVGGVLIDSWNRRTGRCDPGVRRLKSLLGISRDTVFEALKQLTEGDGKLFERIRHGGKSRRNAYRPIWERFEEIVNAFEAQTRVGKLRPSGSGNSD